MKIYSKYSLLSGLSILFGFLLSLMGAAKEPQEALPGAPPDSVRSEVSFRLDVMPIIKRQCLPCHAEDNYNPSELALDSYELLMAGGKNGPPVVPGNAAKSILMQKISPTPPFGDRMPRDPKKKRGQPSTKSLLEDEIRIFREWIERGAKNN